MGRSRGLEPPTPGTTNQCSNQLSYDRHGNACGNHPLLRFPSTPAPLRVRRQRTQARAAHQCAESEPDLQPEIPAREHVASVDLDHEVGDTVAIGGTGRIGGAADPPPPLSKMVALTFAGSSIFR